MEAKLTPDAKRLKNQAADLQRRAGRVPGVKELIDLHQRYAELIDQAQPERQAPPEATTVFCTPQ